MKNETILNIYNNKKELVNTFKLNDLEALKALTSILLQRENGYKKDNKLSYTYNRKGKKIIKATKKIYISNQQTTTYIYTFQGETIEKLLD